MTKQEQISVREIIYKHFIYIILTIIMTSKKTYKYDRQPGETCAL